MADDESLSTGTDDFTDLDWLIDDPLNPLPLLRHRAELRNRLAELERGAASSRRSRQRSVDKTRMCKKSKRTTDSVHKTFLDTVSRM